jgi:ribonucleoside-diphosphate reductase beta chain
LNQRNFITMTRSLRRDSLPMRLFEKAKRFGTWNPSDIDFRQDSDDWLHLGSDEQDLLLRLTALFQAGEEAVTLDLLPLILVVSQEGHLEEELFLTSFLWEEAKHTDYFRRFLDEVVHTVDDLSHYHTPHYRAIIHDFLPGTMQRLLKDSSPVAQVEAIVTYNLIVEGVLAETGYYGALSMLKHRQIMPGHQQGIRLLQRDEARHIAYGIYALSRLIGADNLLWDSFERTTQRLLPHAVGVIDETFACYNRIPFDLVAADLAAYAANQFQKRVAYITHTRGMHLNEIEQLRFAELDDQSS